VKRKLFVLFCCVAFLLCGCGGSAPPEMDDAQEGAVAYGNTTAYSIGTTAALETEAVIASIPRVTEAVAESAPVDTDEETIHYISFHTDTKIYQNEEGQELLRETVIDPVFYSSNTQLSDWVNGYIDGFVISEKNLGVDLLDYAEEELDRIGTEFYTFSHYQTMGVGRHDSDVISVLSLSSMYSGGPNPSTIQTALNLDLRAQRALRLEDVIVENAGTKLLNQVRSVVQEKFALVEEGVYPDYDVVLTNALTYGNMTSHWYFNEKGLVIFFNQYVLAPCAAGIIKAELPYNTLQNVLRPEYMPKEYSGTVTDVQISKSAPQTDQILSISFGKGDTVYIHPVGKASHVQLSQVYFAEGVPVGESMLFSANYLDETHYEDPSIQISIEKYPWEKTVCYVARVKIADPTQLRTASAYGFNRKQVASVKDMAKRMNAVIAINGDYCYYQLSTVGSFLIRQGRTYAERMAEGRDMLLIDDKGDFTIIQDCNYDKFHAINNEKTLINTFSFGPGLIVDGQPLAEGYRAMFNGARERHQRAAIAQVEKGKLEYIIAVSEGDMESEGGGLTLHEWSAFLMTLGVENAYNLDGGNSTAIIFNGEKINAIQNKHHRKLSDIIYFATAYQE